MELFSAWIISMLIGALIGRWRGRSEFGLIISALLGPLGWLITACMKDRRPTCPECRGVVIPGARKCQNCGSVITRQMDGRCPDCQGSFQMEVWDMDNDLDCPFCSVTHTVRDFYRENLPKN